MRRESANGIVFYQFEGLDGAGLTHAILTRLGGVSQGPFATLNLGHTVGDDLNAVQENHRRVFALFGVDRGQVVSPYQVHSAHIRLVGREHGGTVQNGTDGLLTTTPGLMLLFRFADCVPLLLWDPVHRAVGLAHAGWRGVAGGVVRAAVEAFVRHVGSRPEDLWAGIGPAIGPCCYQVGPEVVASVAQAFSLRPDLVHHRTGGLYLDLPGVVRAELEAQGVRQIEMSGICTACHTDEWFSHRAEGGRTGRFGVLVMLDR
jgi:YfiH family protein